jgi:GntR family histidine utilization transcriptional repressor
MPAPAPAPLHRRIRSDIERKILSGVWAPGQRLPFEHELMAQYGCARMTVNKVMSALAQTGLIERRRRAGSFVRQPAGQSAVLDIPDIGAEIVSRGQPYGYELLSCHRRGATDADTGLIAVPAGADLLALRCRHRAGATPFALEERRIALAAVPAAAGVDFAANPPGTWLLRHVPWHEAEHQIAAGNADMETAVELGIPPGTACLIVDRRTWHSGAPVTSVRLWFPGAMQKLVARFTPAARQ